MSGLVSWTEFLHECSICRRQTLQGNFLVASPTGPWLYWVCIECDDYLISIERKEKGPK